MAAITSTASNQAAMEAAYRQWMVRQAQQNAERAEGSARSLRQQAEVAQSEADQARENARSLYVKSDQAQSIAGQARQGLIALRSEGEMHVRLGNTLEQVTARLDISNGEPISSQSSTASPVINASGQLTGTVVNVTA